MGNDQEPLGRSEYRRHRRRSCRNVRITDCTVDVGDDGIALKSGSGPDGIAAGRPTCSVFVGRCTVRNAHGGIVIGSETAAGIWDVEATDCLFDGTDRGIRIKTRRGRGGHIHDLKFNRLTMRDNLCPFTVNMYVSLRRFRRPVLFARTAAMKTIPRDRADPRRCVPCAGNRSSRIHRRIAGTHIKDLVVTDCSFDVAPDASGAIDESEMYNGLPPVADRGIRCRNVEATFNGVTVGGTDRPFILEEGCAVQIG